MTGDTELTILMPCLNEAASVAFCVREALRYIERAGVHAEVLIADNGSTDASAFIAESCGARVVQVTGRGYGSAVLGGIKAAHGRYVIMGDCDGSYDFSDLDPILHKLRQGFALVVGNRFSGGIEPGAMAFSHRYLGVPALSLLGRLRWRTPVGDFHCGQRGFDREKALALNLDCSGMELATAMIGAFAESGASICEVPVRLRRDRRTGRSHLRTLSDGWRHLRLILFGSVPKSM